MCVNIYILNEISGNVSHTLRFIQSSSLYNFVVFID